MARVHKEMLGEKQRVKNRYNTNALNITCILIDIEASNKYARYTRVNCHESARYVSISDESYTDKTKCPGREASNNFIMCRLKLAWHIEIAPIATLLTCRRRSERVPVAITTVCRYFGVFPGSRPPVAISAAPRELLITAGIALIIPPAAHTLNKSLVIERLDAAA